MKKSKIAFILIKYGVPIGLFLLVAAIYIYALCPSLYPGDNPDTVTAAATLSIAHPPGYPLFTMLGWVFSKLPFETIPWRVNLMSTLFSGLSVMMVYLIILKITKNILAGLFGALALAFSVQYFGQSLYADYLSLNNLFITLEIFVILAWYQNQKKVYLYLLAFIAGLAFSHHQTSLLILPGVFYLIFVKNRNFFKSWELAKCFGFFILGLLPFIYLPIRAAQNPAYIWGEPNTLSGFMNMILRKEYGGNDFSLIGFFYYRLWDSLFNLAWKQYYLIGFFLGIFGFLKLRKEDKILANFLLSILIFTALVFPFFANASNLPNSIIYLRRFYILPSLIFALLIGIGFAKMIEKATWQYYLFLILPVIMLIYQYPHVQKRNYYYSIDYAKNIIKNLPENSFVFSVNDSPTFEIWYLQYVEGQRKDLTVIPGGDPNIYVLMPSMEKRIKDYSMSIDEIAQKRPVFTTKFDNIDWPNTMDNFIPQGLIFRYTNNPNWIKDYDAAEVKRYLSNYTLRGVYNTDSVKDYPTQTIIKAYADAWTNYGMALYAQKKLKESAESYFSALQFDPKNEVAWVNYAWVLSDAGMYDQAITEYDKILKIYPKSQKAQKGLQTTLDRRSKVQNK